MTRRQKRSRFSKVLLFPGQRGGVVLIQSKLCEEVSLRIESCFSLCKPWRLMKALPSTEIMLFSLQHSTTDPKTPQRSPRRALSEHPWTDPNTFCWMGSLWEQWGEFWLSRCYSSGLGDFYIPRNKLKLPQELQRQRDDREVKVSERQEKQRNTFPQRFPNIHNTQYVMYLMTYITVHPMQTDGCINKKLWVKCEPNRPKKKLSAGHSECNRVRNPAFSWPGQSADSGGQMPARSWKEVVSLNCQCQGIRATQTKRVWIIDSAAARCSHIELMEDGKHALWRRGVGTESCLV